MAQAEAAAAQATIATLLRRLRDLDLSDEKDNGLKPGVRVKIIKKDKWFGRTGTLRDRRGVLFWNVDLDPLPGDTKGSSTFKKDKFFEVLR